MKQQVKYSQPTREARDEQAIKDIKSYLNKIQWNAMMEIVAQKPPFQQVNFYFGFMGVEGLPVHAFGRKYCLDSYRAWMARDDEDGPGIPTDEHGFRLDGSTN